MSPVSLGKAIDSTTYVAVLLAGDGGLRAGELRVLPWTDANFDQRRLRVERSEWQGHITTTKGNRLRYVPMTRRLADALRAHRHLRSPLVLTQPDGSQMTEAALKEVFFRAERRANLRQRGPHTLKHTFLSHLAMRGAAPLAMKDLGAHRHLATTMRYLHLSPSATRTAIGLLEPSTSPPARGDIVETEDPAIGKMNG